MWFYDSVNDKQIQRNYLIDYTILHSSLPMFVLFNPTFIIAYVCVMQSYSQLPMFVLCNHIHNCPCLWYTILHSSLYIHHCPCLCYTITFTIAHVWYTNLHSSLPMFVHYNLTFIIAHVYAIQSYIHYPCLCYTTLHSQLPMSAIQSYIHCPCLYITILHSQLPMFVHYNPTFTAHVCALQSYIHYFPCLCITILHSSLLMFVLYNLTFIIAHVYAIQSYIHHCPCLCYTILRSLPMFVLYNLTISVFCPSFASYIFLLMNIMHVLIHVATLNSFEVY